jgi:16S rRNA (adenine1518-N6/adenine1519-N6)-dimethyltransferase
MDLTPLPTLTETVKHYGLLSHKGFSKALGQNFILDLSLLRKFVAHIPSLHHASAMEVGPGPGGLTRVILEKNPHAFVAIEPDTQCCAALEPLTHLAPQLRVIQGDARHVTPQGLFPEGPIHIIANLPYNVGTHLLIEWLNNLERVEMLTLMFQREVAERIAAAPDTKAYGRLSVLAQLTCDVHIHMHVSAKAFTPPPKVSSTVVVLKPKAPLYTLPFLKALSLITQAVFSKRRKMLRASLQPLFPHVENTLENLGIVPTARPETLTPNQFETLTQAYLQR